jgi:hypothetical protein
MTDDDRHERRINAMPWEPLPGMVKRRCASCKFYFSTPTHQQSATCPDCTVANRRRQHGAPLRVVHRKQAGGSEIRGEQQHDKF